MPAVTFDIVQHASFLIFSFALLSKCSRHGNAEQFIIIYKVNRLFKYCLLSTKRADNSKYHYVHVQGLEGLGIGIIGMLIQGGYLTPHVISDNYLCVGTMVTF